MAGESSGSAPTEALDEEEDELNSLLRERRRWIEERRASDTNGSVFIKPISTLGELRPVEPGPNLLALFTRLNTGMPRRRRGTRRSETTMQSLR